MTETATFQSGGVTTPPFAFTPDAAEVFTGRAARFRKLAEDSRLAPYLRFLADLSDLQARLVAEAGPAAAPAPQRMAQAKAGAMPPLDRAAIAASPEMAGVLTRFLDAVAAVEMPAQARLALEAVTAATPAEREELLANVLADRIPDDAVAAHLFAAAAAQIEAVRRAAALDAGALQTVSTGICPACGGRPSASIVTAGLKTLEGTRYACCATCATRWNEVRLTCLCCGATKGMSYRSIGGEDSDGSDASVKAELCNQCYGWTKVLYQAKNAGVDPIADDVASLGLDALMRETKWQRGGFDPFLAGY